MQCTNSCLYLLFKILGKIKCNGFPCFFLVLTSSFVSAIRILSFEGACKANTDQGLIDLTPLGQTDGGPR